MDHVTSEFDQLKPARDLCGHSLCLPGAEEPLEMGVASRNITTHDIYLARGPGR